MIVHRSATPGELALRAAQRFAAVADEAIRACGVFRVALAGGGTPLLLYQQLATMSLNWSRVEFFWSDERFVPPEHPASNEGAARRVLLAAIDSQRVFPMLGAETAQGCAARYAALLPEQLDLVLLGIGADGHTASLFAGGPALGEHAPRVLAVCAPTGVVERITLSAAYISRARAVWLLVTGVEKAEALAQVLVGAKHDAATPAQTVARQARHIELFADEAAMQAFDRRR